MRKLLAMIFLTGLFVPFRAFAMVGSVLSGTSYAWSNNAGYINFANVQVTDQALTGYAWSTNYGFIKLNPALGGVLNDGSGNLDGNAWGEQLGWISFGNVAITGGRFTGTATGTLIGTLTFDCPNYCDVETDWRATAENHGSPMYSAAVPPTIPVVEIVDQPLVVQPQQVGILIVNTPEGQVTVQIPANDTFTDFVYEVTPELLDTQNKSFLGTDHTLVNGEFYNVLATDTGGNMVDFFSAPISITLPIDTGTANMGVYWFNDVNSQWVLIPDAVFSPNSVTFELSQPARVAIFATTPSAPTPSIPVVSPSTKPTALPTAPPSAGGSIPGSGSTPSNGVITPTPISGVTGLLLPGPSISSVTFDLIKISLFTAAITVLPAWALFVILRILGFFPNFPLHTPIIRWRRK